MAKLKPCPFCGAEPIVTGQYNMAAEWYQCSCPKCHISQTGNGYRSRLEAFDAWNRRTNDGPAVQAEWQGKGDGYADGALVFDVWHCSECGYCIDDGTDDPERLPNYCPNCGAKMNGGTDNVSD